MGKGFNLPVKSLDKSVISPEAREKVLLIPLFSGEWRKAGEALAYLLSTVRAGDAEKLLENISHIRESPPVPEETAEKWFSALSNLSSAAVVEAVQVFFQLSLTWNQIGPSTGLVFNDLLSLLYRVFQVLSESPGDLVLTQSMIQKGLNWPGRFGFILERTRIGGGNVIRALERAMEIIQDTSPAAEHTLIDFAVETGWYLIGNENLPVWRAVGRNGESLFRKMRGFSVQMDSIRILSGFLGRLEESEQLVSLLEDTITEVIEDISGPLSDEIMSDVLDKLSDNALCALTRRAERDLCLDVMDIKITEGSPIEYGRAVAEMLLFSGGGKAKRKYFKEVFQLAIETANTCFLIEIAKLARERKETVFIEKLKTEYFLDFFPIALKFLENKEELSEIRRMINSIGRLMDAILSQKDPSISIKAMEDCITESKISLDQLLPALILLLRSTKSTMMPHIISRSEIFVRILELLDDDYRRRLLEGEQSHWLTPLATGTLESAEKVVDALGRIVNRNLRGRFMNKVIAPLFQETGTDSSVFTELIITAVSTYNRDMSIVQLRNEESTLLGKLFRAEDRSKALKATMKRLLRIPGIEERRASDLIYCARTLCETLSQQAVWLEKTGHRIFSRFLSSGLIAFVKTLVEYPEVAEHLTGNMMIDLLDQLIPSSETEDSNVALWQLKTASVFFGETIPFSTEILAGRPDTIIQYIREISELAVGSMHGEPAGATFLSWMSRRLEGKLIDEFARKLHDNTILDEVKDDISGTLLIKDWRLVRESAAETLKNAAGSLQIVTRQKLHRRILLREGRRLLEGLIENGCKELISRNLVLPARNEIPRLQEAAGKTDLVEIFRIMESRESDEKKDHLSTEVRDFFRNHVCPPGQNICRYWRKRAFTPLENILINVILLYTGKESLAKIEEMIDDFVEIIGYLGISEDFKPEIVFKALEKSLSQIDRGKELSVQIAERNLEKNVYNLMWRRKATSKAAEAIRGLIPEKKITNSLFDRISRENTAKEQILFTKKYGKIFASVESEIRKRKTSEIKSARSVLEHIWIFNPDSKKPSSAVETARDAVETIAQFFLEIETRTGAVTATEAGAISLGMRRKYRDNARTVAILIKWTQDSSRGDLLTLVEAHQPLLEAVSRDSELIQMIDELWSEGKARLYIRSLADRPDRLKKRLLQHIGKKAGGKEGSIRYV